jgi:hypothetical protein
MSAAGIRRAFMRGSFVISLLVFFVVGGSILLDQWIAGYANARFILGTAILAAGASLGLFAIGSAIGLVIEAVIAVRLISAPAVWARSLRSRSSPIALSSVRSAASRLVDAREQTLGA